MANQEDEDEDWDTELEEAWRDDLRMLLGYYQRRIHDGEERRKVQGRFDGAVDFAVRVSWDLYQAAHPHGLFQLAVHFAVRASGLPPSGPIEIGVVLSFLCKFETALEMLRRKRFEFQDKVEALLNDIRHAVERGQRDLCRLGRWIELQRLGDDCKSDIASEMGVLLEVDPGTGVMAYFNNENAADAFTSALFQHIQAYIRHENHTEWWLSSLEWFHRALMREGEEVHRDAKSNRVPSFIDESHLVLHAVKHSARMSFRTIKEYHDEATRLWNTSRNLNGAPRAPPLHLGAIRSMHCAQTQITVTEYRDKWEIYQQSFDPPRKMIVKIRPVMNVIKTYYPRLTNGEDSGSWPYGPYDLLQAERLQQYHQ